MNETNGVQIILNVDKSTLATLNKTNDILDKISTNIDELVSLTSNANKKLTKMGATANNIYKKVSKGAKKATKDTKEFSSAVKNISFQSLISNTKSLVSMIKNLSDFSVDYIEDLNLLKVAFGDTSDEALGLAESISSITGYDEATIVRKLATFRQLTSTLGTTSETADLLATNLEKMSLDISSLYNVNLDRAAYSLQGALTGQPRSIKSLTGADVTQDTLQSELARLGIDRKVQSLNQAENAIITYLSIERQLINSNGDLARTIEQPANMLRIFTEQVKKAARNIGNLFIPVLQKVIPYLTAFLMVFNEIVGVLMSFLGIDTSSFWEGMSGGSSIIDEWDNSFNNLNSTIKETQLGLRGFDKLNTIKTPTSGSGVGSGLDFGVDSRLIEALQEYDLKLEGIKTKATEIRDNIMKWLGFTKLVDEDTGKVTWKLQDGYTNLEKILDFIKLIIATVASYKILTFIGNIVTAFSSTEPSKGILGGIIAIGEWIGKVFGKTGLTTLGQFGIGIGAILGTATLIYGAFKLLSELDFSNARTNIEWWTEASPETAERIGNVKTKTEELQSAIDMLSYSNMEMSQETYDAILNKIIGLKESFLNELDDWHTKELNKLNELYPTEEDKQTESYKKQKKTLDDKYKEMSALNEKYMSEYTKKFKEFYDNDKKISAEERLQLLEIQNKMDALSIEALTTSLEEKEKLQKEYLEDAEANENLQQVRLLEQQKKNYDEALNLAEENYKKRKANLDKESEDYETLLKDLEEERKTAISKAQVEYDKFYENWAKANSEIAEFIDKDTGTIFSNMQEKFGGLEGSIIAITNTLKGTAHESVAEIVDFYKVMGNKIYDSYDRMTYEMQKYGKAHKKAYVQGFNEVKDPTLKIDMQGGYKGFDVTQKADGGFVDSGQFFIAREAGPELVGRIGHKTAVANNDQIVNAVSQGVTNAIIASGGFGNSTIVIKAEGDTNGLMNFITFKQQEQDMQYGN